MKLKDHFITVPREYQEGTVEVFKQKIPSKIAKKSTFAITALRRVEAEGLSGAELTLHIE